MKSISAKCQQKAFCFPELSPLLTLVCIFFVNSQSLYAADSCKDFLAIQSIEKPMIADQVTKEPIFLFGALVGDPPKRKSVLDSNRSHFGEYAKYRPFFYETMKHILETDFNRTPFFELSLAKQTQAVDKFIEITILEKDIDILGNNFYVAYLRKWGLEKGRLNGNAAWAYLDFLKLHGRNPQSMKKMFGHFFILYFRYGEQMLNSASDLLEALWTMRVLFTDIAHDMEKRLNVEIKGLNPVGVGNNKELKVFLNSSGALFFDLQVLRNDLLKIEEQSYQISQNDDQVLRLQMYTKLWNKLSQLIVRIEVFLANKTTVEQALLSKFEDEIDSMLRFSWFKGFFGEKNGLSDVQKQELKQKYGVLFEAIGQFENQSLVILVHEISSAIKALDENRPDIPLHHLNGMTKQTLTEMTGAIDYQKTIILGNLTRFKLKYDWAF